MFVGGISDSDWDTLSSEGQNYPLMSRAIAWTVSGSTIKALTTFAGLKYGICDDSTGIARVSGLVFEQYGMHCCTLATAAA